MTDRDAVRDRVAAAARRLAEAGLLIGTAGNVSARTENTVAVTATGVTLADCTPDQVTVVDLDGTVLAGELRPTSEVDLHLGIYHAHGPGAVVHTHAPYATALGCVLDQLPVLHYQQLALGGEVPVAPYATFGTPELAGHVRDALTGRSAALMANHGSVTTGPDLDTAVENALLLEWVCQLHHRASAHGTPRSLDADQQADVIHAALAQGYGSTHRLEDQP